MSYVSYRYLTHRRPFPTKAKYYGIGIHNPERFFFGNGETDTRLWLLFFVPKPALGSKWHELFDTALTAATGCSPHRPQFAIALEGCIVHGVESHRWQV